MEPGRQKTKTESERLDTKMELEGWKTTVMFLNQRASVEPENVQTNMEPMEMRMMVE